MADDEFYYESGFGSEFVTEAVEGAPPEGRNSPQRAPLGLYAANASMPDRCLVDSDGELRRVRGRHRAGADFP